MDLHGKAWTHEWKEWDNSFRLSPLNHEIDDNGGGGGDDVDGGIGIVAIGVMVVVRALYLTV